MKGIISLGLCTYTTTESAYLYFYMALNLVMKNPAFPFK
jgi:hypothetical protein